MNVYVCYEGLHETVSVMKSSDLAAKWVQYVYNDAYSSGYTLSSFNSSIASETIINNLMQSGKYCVEMIDELKDHESYRFEIVVLARGLNEISIPNGFTTVFELPANEYYPEEDDIYEDLLRATVDTNYE